MLVLVFLFLSLIGILNHEMWLDELQAWTIARDSSSLIDLYQNLRYEGHPGLWHICLYIITRFTRNPLFMELFHVLLATTIIFLFTNSPFTKLQKILFSFGYFPFFEYNLISRNYNLGVLLIFLFCTLFPHREKSYLLLAIVLALLANTNAYGLMISVSLMLTLIFDKVFNYKDLKELRKSSNQYLIISLIIFILGVIIALIQIVQPTEAKFKGNQETIKQTNIYRFASTVVAGIWKGYIPVPNFFDYHFWNTNLFSNSNIISLKIFSLLISLGLLLFAIVLFIRKPVALFMYLSGNCIMFWFTYAKFSGSIRHQGHFFILFVACLWISVYYSHSENFISNSCKFLIKFFERYKNQYLTIILSIHLIAGIFAYSMDLIYPFYPIKEVAKFLESKQLDRELIIGSRDYLISPLTGFIDRKIYFIESSEFGSFINWNKRKDITHQAVLAKVNEIIRQKNTNALLILSYKLDTERPELIINEIYKSNRSIFEPGVFYVYFVESK